MKSDTTLGIAFFMGFGIYSLYRRFQPGFRQLRRGLFLRLFSPTEATTILDVGGNVYDWYDFPTAAQITVLNLSPLHPEHRLLPNMRYVQGDGCNLPFADQYFDIVYSNSVIEHLKTWEHQKAFASEARRVGKGYFIQTPNRWFPIEPHFVAPLFHFLPKRTQSLFLPHFSLRGMMRSGDDSDLKSLFTELRLLSEREVKQLCPDADIERERLLGMTKSLMAVKRPQLAPRLENRGVSSNLRNAPA